MYYILRIKMVYMFLRPIKTVKNTIKTGLVGLAGLALGLGIAYASSQDFRNKTHKAIDATVDAYHATAEFFEETYDWGAEKVAQVESFYNDLYGQKKPEPAPVKNAGKEDPKKEEKKISSLDHLLTA